MISTARCCDSPSTSLTPPQWFTGLIQAAYGLTAFDSVIHMVEEIPAPRHNAPRAIWLSVVIGAISGFLFMVVCLFSIQDLDTVINADLPFMQLVQDAIGLQGGAVLLSLFIFNGLGQGISIFTTGSRLTWSFSRDGGIPFSGFFAAVDPTWKVPARAILLQSGVMGLIGLLYLFANTVLEAILSTATIALTVSYGMPILALMVAGREKLPPGGFRLGSLGPVCNWVSVIYCGVTTVFFFFPGAPNPAPADMNYAIVVFGVVLVVSVSFWFVKGRLAYMHTADAALRVAEAQNREMLIHEGVAREFSREDMDSSGKSDYKKT